MNVTKLKSYITDYRRFLEATRNFPNPEHWDAMQNFQNNWDIENPDLGTMYDASLQSQMTQRIWKRENWRPKAVMLQLIQLEPDFARRMFKNLLDESQDIENRISMFKFGCDEMLVEFKKRHSTTIENNHYHDDNEMIFKYLTFVHPEQYTFFEYEPFIKTLEQLGITDLPSPYDLSRFLKLTKILYTFIKKDEQLIEIHRQKRVAQQLFTGNSKLIVHDFYTFCGKQKF